jgi:hypothetical protein
MRIGAGARSAAWLVWLAVAVWLTAPGFVWEVQYFHNPGAQFFRIVVILLAAFPPALWGYQRWRRGGLWQWELVIMAAVPFVAAVVYEARAAAVTLLAVAASYSIGRRLRRWLGIPAEGAVEDLTISTGLGLGIFQCVLSLLGLAGWYTVPAFLAWILLCLVAGGGEIPALWTAFGRLHRTWGATADLRGWAGTLAAVFGAAFVTCSVMVTLAPSLAFDVLRVHLPLVHYYAAHHALRTPDYLSYGYLPQGVETLMTLGYVLGGDPAAQMLPPVYFALAMLMAYRIGRMCGLTLIGSLAGTLFAAAAAAVHWTGSVPKNDVAVAFFMLAALHGYLRWRESGEFRSVLAGAFFLAMAADVKDSVVYALPPLALFYTHAAIQQPKPVRAMLKLAAVFLLFGTFWHARAWLVMGNPIYPFSAQAAVTSHGSGPGWRSLLVHCLRLPWDVHFHGRRYFESPLDSPMGIALVLFVPVWLLAWRKVNRAEAACLLFCGLYLLYWALVQGTPRFAIAPILILFVLTAGRVVLFCRGMPPVVKFSLYAAAAYALLFGLLGVAIVEINAPQLRYFARRIDRAEYLREALLPYRAVEFVRSAAHPGDAVLSVNACPFVYAPDPGLFDCVWPRDLNRSKLNALLLRRDYRFLILPASRAGEIPPGWQAAYADESYRVLIRKAP